MQLRVVGERNGHALLCVYVRRIVEVRADVEVLPDQFVSDLGVDADRKRLLQILVRVSALIRLLVSLPGEIAYSPVPRLVLHEYLVADSQHTP